MINEFLLNNSYEYQINKAGIKVVNLLPYKLYTPEFIVLSTDFYEGWKLEKTAFIASNNSTISKIAIHFQRLDCKLIILRSSCTTENITDRGKYYSEKCKPNVEDVSKVILKIFEDFEVQRSGLETSIAILIQIYVQPKIQGHLSNERRVNASKMHWLLEEEAATDSPNKSTIILIDNISSNFDQSFTNCLNYSSLIKGINSLASFFSNLDERFHFEWLWDGKTFWLLQIDKELECTYKNSKPGSEWLVDSKKAKTGSTIKDLEVLETVGTTINDWHKISCVKLFKKCNLPYWQIYILENETVINELMSGSVNISLRADLTKLLETPIVIRTDTKRSDILLPRTETIYTLEKTIEFLKDKTKEFLEKGLKTDEFCFLIHQFIVSIAGALSYTKPNIDIVRIDSTWGIVEGLYYHPHDSFEVNYKSTKPRKKIRRKDQYIDVNKNGEWYFKESGTNFDWKSSLTDDQILTIANFARIIAKELNSPATVMFFINNKKSYPEVLPWFYTINELPENTANHTNLILSVRNKVIKSKADFMKLKEESQYFKKVNLLIDLNIEICRDKKIIEDIAEFAKQNNYTVDLEGSVLSHAYYVFQSKGVNVRCIDPFDSTYGTKEFYKLVRDKIPILIANNNEEVVVKRVAPKELLVLLKSKIVEEAFEFYWSKSNENTIEEMADVFEVLLGACKIFGLNLSDLEKIAAEKRDARGGFEEGIVLIATKEQSVIKLSKQNDTLFPEDDKEINVKLSQKKQYFQRGDIDNFKSLTEVDKIHLPYLNSMTSKTNNFRYLLKPDNYSSISIEYDPKNIILTLEASEPDINDPSQLGLF